MNALESDGTVPKCRLLFFIKNTAESKAQLSRTEIQMDAK